MTNHHDQRYFHWLISQIGIPNNRSYNDLFTLMHNKEFVWLVSNDDNRVQDGRNLRAEFLDGVRHDFPQPVSILEVLIGLSRRVAFTAGGDAEFWAWQLIANLRLQRMHDPLTEQKVRRVDDILERLVWRTYGRDGRGGFFPLENAIDDQTKLEIWFQMNTYVNEIQEP